MPFTFSPNRVRPGGNAESQRSATMGLVFQLVSIVTTQRAEATRVIFITEFSWPGLIAVFVLLFCASVWAISKHGANINHTNHMLLFTHRWNVRLHYGLMWICCRSASWLYEEGVQVLITLCLVLQLTTDKSAVSLLKLNFILVKYKVHQGFWRPRLTVRFLLLFDKTQTHSHNEKMQQGRVWSFTCIYSFFSSSSAIHTGSFDKIHHITRFLHSAFSYQAALSRFMSPFHLLPSGIFACDV